MLGRKIAKKLLFLYSLYVLVYSLYSGGCFKYNKTLWGTSYLKCIFNVSPSLPGCARSPPDILEVVTNSWDGFLKSLDLWPDLQWWHRGNNKTTWETFNGTLEMKCPGLVMAAERVLAISPFNKKKRPNKEQLVRIKSALMTFSLLNSGIKWSPEEELKGCVRNLDVELHVHAHSAGWKMSR